MEAIYSVDIGFRDSYGVCFSDHMESFLVAAYTATDAIAKVPLDDKEYISQVTLIRRVDDPEVIKNRLLGEVES